MSNLRPDLRNDRELIRVINILTADELLLQYIKKNVLSRLTEESMLETNWLKAVIDFSVEEAIHKLNLDQNIASLKRNSLKMPNYSELEPSSTKSKQATLAKLNKPYSPQVVNEFKEDLSNTNRPKSAKLSTSRATMSAQDYMQQVEYQSINTQINTELSPRRGAILVSDDDVLPYITLNNDEDELPNLSEDSSSNIEPDHSAEDERETVGEQSDNSPNNEVSLQIEDIESETSMQHQYDYYNKEYLEQDVSIGNDNNQRDDQEDDISMDDSEISTSRHVRFKANLESVLHVQNLLSDLDEEQQRALFFTQFEGNRSNYCYQKQKDIAEQEGYPSWSDWINNQPDEELSVLDEVLTRDFDDMYAS